MHKVLEQCVQAAMSQHKKSSEENLQAIEGYKKSFEEVLQDLEHLQVNNIVILSVMYVLAYTSSQCSAGLGCISMLLLHCSM